MRVTKCFAHRISIAYCHKTEWKLLTFHYSEIRSISPSNASDATFISIKIHRTITIDKRWNQKLASLRKHRVFIINFRTMGSFARRRVCVVKQIVCAHFFCTFNSLFKRIFGRLFSFNGRKKKKRHYKVMRTQSSFAYPRWMWAYIIFLVKFDRFAFIHIHWAWAMTILCVLACMLHA